MSSEMCDKLVNSVTESFSFLEINQITFKGVLELWKSKRVSSTKLTENNKTISENYSELVSFLSEQCLLLYPILSFIN
ncbi:hypothetical protein QTP88_023939 [Uroleucon formosanum]